MTDETFSAQFAISSVVLPVFLLSFTFWFVFSHSFVLSIVPFVCSSVYLCLLFCLFAFLPILLCVLSFFLPFCIYFCLWLFFCLLSPCFFLFVILYLFFSNFSFTLYFFIFSLCPYGSFPSHLGFCEVANLKPDHFRLFKNNMPEINVNILYLFFNKKYRQFLSLPALGQNINQNVMGPLELWGRCIL